MKWEIERSLKQIVVRRLFTFLRTFRFAKANTVNLVVKILEQRDFPEKLE